MADVDRRHTSIAKTADELIQLFRFMLRQAARRLVKNDDLRSGADRGRDLQHLLLTGGELADSALDVDVSLDRAKHRLGLAPHSALIEESARRRKRSEAKVLGDGQVLAERKLLVDHANARRKRLFRPAENDRLSKQNDAAGISRVDAGQDLAQRALAGAVLAAERVARAGSDVEADILEGTRARKSLRDVLETDGRRRHGIFKYASGTSVKPQSLS